MRQGRRERLKEKARQPGDGRRATEQPIVEELESIISITQPNAMQELSNARTQTQTGTKNKRGRPQFSVFGFLLLVKRY